MAEIKDEYYEGGYAVVPIHDANHLTIANMYGFKKKFDAVYKVIHLENSSMEALFTRGGKNMDIKEFMFCGASHYGKIVDAITIWMDLNDVGSKVRDLQGDRKFGYHPCEGKISAHNYNGFRFMSVSDPACMQRIAHRYYVNVFAPHDYNELIMVTKDLTMKAVLTVGADKKILQTVIIGGKRPLWFDRAVDRFAEENGYRIDEKAKDPANVKNQKNNDPSDHFLEMMKRLPKKPDECASVWTDGQEILCRTPETAYGFAEAIKSMYAATNDDARLRIGFYNPEKNPIGTSYRPKVGWWYVKK